MQGCYDVFPVMDALPVNQLLVRAAAAHEPELAVPVSESERAAILGGKGLCLLPGRFPDAVASGTGADTP